MYLTSILRPVERLYGAVLLQYSIVLNSSGCSVMIFFRVTRLAVTVTGAALLAGCAPREEAPSTVPAPYVRVARPAPVQGAAFGASGTVRARIEAPLAFEVGGRVVSRRVDAGQGVRAGETLMTLDPRDLDEAVQAALAEHAAAGTALATADADLQRVRQLVDRSLVSRQSVERAELQRREAQSRLDAAAARLSQARNARGYAVLGAPADGVLIDVTAEPGQVVAAGQTVATLARGAREIEVFLPDGVAAPARGAVNGIDGPTLPLVLREVAGAVDPIGRTRRTRYTVEADGEQLVLGSIVTTRFELERAGVTGDTVVFALPIAALDERGQRPQVWRVREGRAQAVAVQVIGVDDRSVRVVGTLQPEDRIIALGTHLLREGMEVRERPAP